MLRELVNYKKTNDIKTKALEMFSTGIILRR